MKNYVCAFIGTFFLVFTVGMVSIDPAVPDGFAPIAIGTVLAVMIFATGHISGGHLNPAVTLGVLILGKITLNIAAFYWITQLLAGVVAALTVGLMKPALPASAQVTLDSILSRFWPSLYLPLPWSS